MKPCRFSMQWHPLVAVLLAVLFCPYAPPAHALEKATIQLKWLHHFQFAGYYMALEKGFYREAGLDVTIREGGPNLDVDTEVESGRADFGVGTSALLLNLAKGQDFIVLGQVFQHSPAIFLTPRKTGIQSVKEMAGKRFMHFTQHGDMQALLKKNGITEQLIIKVPQQGDPRDLIEGKADVMLAYSFNEPYVMELAGEPYYAFSAATSGIDFYGDNLFTTGRTVRNRPEFVRAFREASLRGWHYALEHKAEAVDHILATYPRGLSREHLLFEADGLDNLIQPQLVELGYQSRARWQRISETFADLGMLPKGFNPEPIIYAPKQAADHRPVAIVTLLAAAIIAVLSWLLVTFRRLNMKLEDEFAQRRLIEESLRRSQELFSLLMQHTPVYTFIKEIDGSESRVVVVSDNFCDMVGIPVEEIGGKTMTELFPAEFARKMTADDLSIVQGDQAVEFDEALNGRSYTTIKFPLCREGSNPLIAGFTIDVTERRLAEAQLRESDERFRLAFDNANVGMCLVDTEGVIFKVNQQMSAMFGYRREELEGMSVNSIAHPDYQQVSPAFIRSAANGNGDHAAFEKAYIHKDGTLVWARVSSSLVRNAGGEPLYFISHVLDITEQKQAEEARLAMERQLLHTQKLESLGVLAGGIAHDFNNILMAVIGNADLALMKLNAESPVVGNLRQIEQAAARAADLAKQMLAYSGKGKFRVEQVDLNRLLREMGQMLEASIARTTELRLDLAPELPAVEADASQLHQVVMNLVINAAEAMEERCGVITVTTSCLESSSLQQEFCFDGAPPEGRYVMLEVADTGCGMDQETQGRIFDPFFTTKFTGRGLGMAAVHGIVRGHKGGIRVTSVSGNGSVVTVLLPASDRPVAAAAASLQRDCWQGRGTILLVDDEEAVRGVGAAMLAELGFTVITAGDGREALDKFAAADNVGVVILDLTMPKLDGEQCFHELRRLDEQVRVIISSGYSEQEVARRFQGADVAGFIQKPYTLTVLRDAVQKVT